MINRFLILFFCFGYCQIMSAQVAHGSIYVDITTLCKEINSLKNLSIKDKKVIDNILSKQGYSIYPSYSMITTSEEDQESLIFSTPYDEELIMYEYITIPNFDKKTHTYGNGWVNFSYRRKSYYVTKITKNNEEMYIYIYTGGILKEKANNPEIHNIYYHKLQFRPGTYLINLFNENSSISAQPKIVDDDSLYYDLGIDSLIVYDKGIEISKIENEAISPEEIEKYYKNKELKRPKAVKKILSVFED